MSGLLAFALFAFVSSVTPGPANVAILANTVATGFRRSTAFVLGILAGFLVVLVVCAVLYLAGLSLAGRWLLAAKVIGAAYLLYLAYTIARTRYDGRNELIGARGAVKGAVIHPLSIKAWLFVLVSFATFATPEQPIAMVPYVGIFFVAAVVAHLAWMLAGSLLNRRIDQRHLTTVNRIAAVALALTVLSIFLP